VEHELVEYELVEYELVEYQRMKDRSLLQTWKDELNAGFGGFLKRSLLY
jgi:hypothetical protein